MEGISVVIPMYNEQVCVYDVIGEALKIVPAITEDFEIIAVDDKSSDNTCGILNSLALEDRRIKVIRNFKRRGLGGSIRAGFEKATKEIIFYTDADIPCDFKEFKKAIMLMQNCNADIVSAYRVNKKTEGLKRYLYSVIYNRIIDLLFKINIKDINFSLKLFKRAKLEALQLKSEGSFINAELFIKARRMGYKIIQFPTLYLPRRKGRSKLDSLNNILKILYELFVFFKKSFG